MGCDCNKKGSVRLRKVGTERVIWKLSGMHCQHCVMMVQSILEAADFKDIHVEKGQVSFQAERGRVMDDIFEALKELGYELK